MSKSDNADADTSNVSAIAGEKNEIPKKEDESEDEQIVSDNDLWIHRLEENRISRRKEGKFFSLESGETVDFEVIEIVGPVEKDFDGDKKTDAIQYQYKIRDLNDLDGEVKIWDLSKSWSEALDFQLSQGHRMIRASRKGSGMQTKYYFSALNVHAGAQRGK